MQTRIRVVLPAPFGPTSAVTLPAGIVRSTASSATFLRKRLLRPCAASAAVPFEAPTSAPIPHLRLASLARHRGGPLVFAGTVASREGPNTAGEPATNQPDPPRPRLLLDATTSCAAPRRRPNQGHRGEPPIMVLGESISALDPGLCPSHCPSAGKALRGATSCKIIARAGNDSAMLPASPSPWARPLSSLRASCPRRP